MVGLEQKRPKMLNHEADKRACNDGERGGLSRKGRKCLIMKRTRGLATMAREGA
jgi:hypothetical protein